MWYAVTTGLTPHEALQQATAYFGRGGVGLHAIAQTPQRLVFQGGGGHVAIRGQPSATTTLALEARGWDIAGQRFMGQVSHRPRWWAGNAGLHRHSSGSPFSTMRWRRGPIDSAFWGLRSTSMVIDRVPELFFWTGQE